MERNARAKPGGRGGLVLRPVLGLLLLVATAVFAYGLIASLVLVVHGASTGRLPDSGTLLGGAACLVLAVICAWVPAAARRSARRSYRLDAFARANGGVHDPREDTPDLRSAVFEPGDVERRIGECVRITGTRDVEFGNYRGERPRIGYVAIGLSTPLPPMVLELTGGRSIVRRRYPRRYDTTHQLALPRPFDRVFTLHALPQSADTARELFDAHLLAQLSRRPHPFEVEAGGARLLLYTRGEVSTTDPAAWRDVLTLTSSVVDRVESLEGKTTR